jgi:hypothetical protein
LKPAILAPLLFTKINKMRFTKSIAVELKIQNNTNGSQQLFLDVPQLKGKFIQGIEAFTQDQVAKTFTQNNVIPALATNGILVNIVVNSDTILENISYFTLVAAFNAGLIREYKNLKININKSGIYIGDNTNILVGQAVLFTFYYTDKEI